MSGAESPYESDMTSSSSEKNVGRYELRKAIGSGSRGQVYLAYDPLLDSLVAIKMLHHNGADEAVVRFQKEAIATGKLKHPRIAQTLDFGIADGLLYMVMEFVDGESLAKVLEREGSLPVERALPLFLDICDGLTHAHAHGIFHRDLKPANVIVVKSEVGEFAKLVDFGIAKIQGDDHVVTDPNAIVGSPIYMSPEQCKGELCDARSDVYSLGCLMFETLSGRPPFFCDTAIDTIKLKTSMEAPDLSSVMDTTGMPAAILTVVTTCLRREPSERFQNVSAIEQALDEITLDHESLNTPSSEPAGKRTAAKPLVYAGVALGVVLLGAAQVAKQILHEDAISDNSKFKVLSSSLDSAEFYTRTTKYIDPLKAESDDGVLRHDDSKSFGVQLQNELPLLANGNQKNCFVVLDPKFPDRIRAKRVVHDEDFKQLEGRTGLRILYIDHAGALVGTGMRYLENLPLTELRVENTMMKNVALEHFCNIRSLQFLSIHDGINFTDEGLKNIGNLKKLRMFELSSANISDRGMQYISNASELELLMLTRSIQVTDDSIPSVIRLSKLKTLNLSDTGITARGVAALARGRNKISELMINGLPWSDQSIEALAAMPSLVLLSMENTNVTDELVKKLTQVKGLQCVNIEAKYLSADGVKALKALPNLGQLHLKNPVVSLDFLNSLAALDVRVLELNRATNLYDSQLFRLQNMPRLEFLSLSDCNDKDVTWNGIQEFKRNYSKRWKRNIEVGYDARGIAE